MCMVLGYNPALNPIIVCFFAFIYMFQIIFFENFSMCTFSVKFVRHDLKFCIAAMLVFVGCVVGSDTVVLQVITNVSKEYIAYVFYTVYT
jgi:hypothetical protein